MKQPVLLNIVMAISACLVYRTHVNCIQEQGFDQIWRDTIKGPRGPFHSRYFARNSNSMETSPCCNSVASHQIAINIYTRHDCTALVSCTKFCSDHCIEIEVRVKRNFHRIWIGMESNRTLSEILHVITCFPVVTVRSNNFVEKDNESFYIDVVSHSAPSYGSLIVDDCNFQKSMPLIYGESQGSVKSMAASWGKKTLLINWRTPGINNWRSPVTIWRPPLINWRTPNDNWRPRVIIRRPQLINWMPWAVKWCTRDSFRKESHLFTSKQPAKCQSDINILTQSRGYRDFTWSYDKTLYRILKGKLGSFEVMAQGRISQFHSALRRNNIINFASNGTHCPDDYIKHGAFRILMLRKQDKYSVNNDVWETIQMICYWYHVISDSMIWNNMIHNITWHNRMWYE